ncbi:DUF5134 domain-containing protein [Streptomyces pluripotens]|uniref:DUF5134 domain-containing protein n=1 Tax=Streptomyces pluripotens TaxID=1355015 RepID=A0A221P631_9ACTN|nr:MULTISPECIES: DUF5134 domain-containing protein [Streptomyces]ARP73468.1 DUF5134 domain-containing protein [Streptomyces pluripotens]ASN27719.1 DUF5134 domain-containing protein [Streptomyces pluripotens]KIE26877.1 membrane protein [Streptomyces sp. MUSC 125]MCH0557378.1 DUF5134 domain-containing protein [Streptomyces sp. MUM 16J]
MHGPVPAAWLLVALCAATGAYCLLRMRSSVEEQRRAAGGEAVMGFGMAAMAVPAAVFAPPRWAWPVYASVFAGAALRAWWATRSSRHHLHHLVGSAAMVYMSVAMAISPPSAHQTHCDAGVPQVTGGLILYFTGYVLLSGARLVPTPAAPDRGGAGAAGSGGWGDRPELAQACRLSMGIGMVTMLLAM